MNRLNLILVMLSLSYSCQKQEVIHECDPIVSDVLEQPLTLEMNLSYEDSLEHSGNPFIGSSEAFPTSRSIESKFARTGAFCIKHELRIKDPIVSGSKRCESNNMDMKSARIKSGDTWFYGFSLYLPSTWIDDGKYADILAQWKGFSVDVNGNTELGIPFMSVIQKNNALVLRYDYDTNESPSNETLVKGGQFDLVKAPLPTGKWHDFRFRVVWEYKDNGMGRIEVDHKLDSETSYQRVLNYKGPNMYNSGGYLKWGIYKPSWNTSTYDGGISYRAVWHDNFRIGSSWSDVDPSGLNLPGLIPIEKN